MKGTVMLVTIWLLAAGLAAPSFDHSAFDALLRQHVEGGLVDYDAFARSEGFGRYLEKLARADLEDLSARERLAFWINVYNAYTIRQINAHDERESIRNINKTLGLLPGEGPWSEEMVRAAGSTLSLDDVEHGIIRQQFDEPRIHFALVCAALGCPPLRGEAYTAERLDEQLEDQARIFILESPSKNRVDVEAREVWASPVFFWYEDDFGGTDAALGRFLARYHPQGPARQLLESGQFRLRKTDYDWTLNSIEKGRASSSR
jgi:hypothetical protein